MTDNELCWLRVGNKVWWEDPDNSESSGEYEILEIRTDSDNILYDDTIILIGNGLSEAEVWALELRPILSNEH